MSMGFGTAAQDLGSRGGTQVRQRAFSPLGPPITDCGPKTFLIDSQVLGPNNKYKLHAID